MQDKYGYTLQRLADVYGDKEKESYRYYAYKLDLLKLPSEIQNQLLNARSKINETHCRHICKLLNKVKLQ